MSYEWLSVVYLVTTSSSISSWLAIEDVLHSMRVNGVTTDVLQPDATSLCDLHLLMKDSERHLHSLEPNPAFTDSVRIALQSIEKHQRLTPASPR